MIRGTTPLHTFELPFPTDEIKEVHIIYLQNESEVLVKTKKDCEFNENLIQTELSQEDTFLFDDKYPVEIQMRVLTYRGKVLNSVVTTIDCYRCLESEVLV